MAAPKPPTDATPAAPTLEELQAQLEEAKQAQAKAELEAVQAKTAAAQAQTEADTAKSQLLAMQPVPGGVLQNIEGKMLAVGGSLVDDIQLVGALVAKLRALGYVFQDHSQIMSRGPDGTDRPRWQGFQRALMHTDILGVREEPDETGYVVVTGDGQKYRNVTP
jgi:hypothetical protein